MTIKRFVALVGLCAVLTGCAARTPVVTPPIINNADFTVTVVFNYDFTNFVPCSATVTKGCITGFTWGYMQGGTQVPLKTSPTTICTGATQPESCTDTTNAVVGFGQVTPYAQVNGIDNSGANGSASTIGATPANVALGSPINVTESFK